MHIVSSGITDIGRKRGRNEDAFLINEELNLYVVADGMGGHAGGEYASSLAVNTVEECIGMIELPGSSREDGPDPVEFLRGQLSHSVSQAGRKIYDWACEHTEFWGMGTTVVVLLVHEGNAYIAHVGDSRVYLVRSGVIEQVTEDHSLVAQSVREGLMTPEEAKNHRLGNVITRALGSNPEVEVDVQVRAVRRGDKFLLCSDGLSGHVEDEEMKDLVINHEVQEAGRQLVGLACARGGKDNITVVVVEVD